MKGRQEARSSPEISLEHWNRSRRRRGLSLRVRRPEEMVKEVCRESWFGTRPPRGKRRGMFKISSDGRDIDRPEPELRLHVCLVPGGGCQDAAVTRKRCWSDLSHAERRPWRPLENSGNCRRTAKSRRELDGKLLCRICYGNEIDDHCNEMTLIADALESRTFWGAAISAPPSVSVLWSLDDDGFISLQASVCSMSGN